MKSSALCGLALGAGFAAYSRVLRPWHLRWGATDEEIARTMPGDEEVRDASLVATRAVTIEASPQAIWPWLAQIGKGRGGFYSYDWIENLMGLGITSSDRILPEFQDLKAGDQIPGLGPVKALERNHYWLLAAHEPWGDVSWLVTLYPLDEQRTRLISRTRYRLRWRTLMRSLPLRFVPFYLFFEPGEFVMVRKMLLGIKHRAERYHEGSMELGADTPRAAKGTAQLRQR